jgi:hypothetical protein
MWGFALALLFGGGRDEAGSLVMGLLVSAIHPWEGGRRTFGGMSNFNVGITRGGGDARRG